MKVTFYDGDKVIMEAEVDNPSLPFVYIPGLLPAPKEIIAVLENGKRVPVQIQK